MLFCECGSSVGISVRWLLGLCIGICIMCVVCVCWLLIGVLVG